MAKLEKNIANVGSKVGKLGNNLVKQTNGMSKKLLPKKAYNVTHRYMYISFVVFVLLLGFLLKFLYKKYMKKESMTEEEEEVEEEEEEEEDEEVMENKLLNKEMNKKLNKELVDEEEMVTPEMMTPELEGFTMY